MVRCPEISDHRRHRVQGRRPLRHRDDHEDRDEAAPAWVRLDDQQRKGPGHVPRLKPWRAQVDGEQQQQVPARELDQRPRLDGSPREQGRADEERSRRDETIRRRRSRREPRAIEHQADEIRQGVCVAGRVSPQQWKEGPQAHRRPFSGEGDPDHHDRENPERRGAPPRGPGHENHVEHEKRRKSALDDDARGQRNGGQGVAPFRRRRQEPDEGEEQESVVMPLPLDFPRDEGAEREEDENLGRDSGFRRREVARSREECDENGHQHRGLERPERAPHRRTGLFADPCRGRRDGMEQRSVRTWLVYPDLAEDGGQQRRVTQCGGRSGVGAQAREPQRAEAKIDEHVARSERESKEAAHLHRQPPPPERAPGKAVRLRCKTQRTEAAQDEASARDRAREQEGEAVCVDSRGMGEGKTQPRSRRCECHAAGTTEREETIRDGVARGI